jgi:hypothetical protein
MAPPESTVRGLGVFRVQAFAACSRSGVNVYGYPKVLADVHYTDDNGPLSLDASKNGGSC